jgi:3-phenylpropionate/cinnamic acid dioxygenase small subunit
VTAIAPHDTAPGTRLWCEVQDLFAAHAECLDDDRLDEWLDLFVDACLYLVIPRENVDRGLPLAAIRCESRGYLQDRVVAVRETSMYAPRSQRHVVGPARVEPAGDGRIVARASYAVFQTLVEEPTEVFNAGRYEAVIEVSAERLRFAELRCIYDSTLVPNSIVKPI